MMRMRREERELAIQPLPLALSPSQGKWRRGGQVEEAHLSPCFGGEEVDRIQITSVCSHS